MENSFSACAMATSLLPSLRGSEHRRDLAVIIAAAAEIPGQGSPRLGFGRLRIFQQQGFARHDLPGRAKATLRAVVLDKRLLQRIQLVSLRQAFDGENLFPFHPHRELAARVNVAAIDNHRAGAAFAAVTADLRTGETQFIPQDLAQSTSMLNLNTVISAVDFEVD